MKKKLLNYFFLLSLSSSLVAMEDTDYMSDDNNPATVKRASMGDITPAVAPVVKHGIDGFVLADFIYWSTRVDNLLYKHQGTLSTKDQENVILGKKNIKELLNPPESTYSTKLNHKMAPGFKAGIGANFSHDGWDSLIRYTWFHSKASEISSEKDFAYANEISFSKFVVFNNFSTIIKESASNWMLHFNNIDWELGRTFYISPKLILRPNIGLKGSWQNQYYSIYMTDLIDETYDLDNLSLKTKTTGSYIIHSKQSFWGIGIRPGFSTSWLLTKEFSIFGDTNISALWSYFDSSRTDTATQTTNDSTRSSFKDLTVTNSIERNHMISPVLELAIGLRWEVMCSNDDYRIRLQAAWEEQLWWNQNHFININGFNPYGNLSLQGLTIEARIDF